jgi:predicted ATPase/pimeloyl-ACP methyl ester carboxylesterase
VARQLTARSAIVAVIGALASSFFGSTWYLAEKIRSQALAVTPGPALPPFDDVQFTAVRSGTAQLRAVGAQPALSKPALYGIAWQGGIGQLGPLVTVSGGAVTRPLTVISGSAPAVGQYAALDASCFLGDPATALGIPVHDVVVPGPLGPLPAWYFPAPGATFVIGVHGQNGTRRDLLRIIDVVHRMGFPALAVTYRNDLGTVHDPSGYHRYGQAEWSDIEAAVRWSLAQGARRVVLAGQSMGGGVVAAFLGRSPLAQKVTRVVLDAPMLDLHAAVGHQADRHLLPVVRRLSAPLIWAAKRVASARFGVDWSAASYLDETTWLKVPALVTHGEDDPRVPISISVRLSELKPSLVTFERFPGAGHLESWNVDRSRYASLVESFLEPVKSGRLTRQPTSGRDAAVRSAAREWRVDPLGLPDGDGDGDPARCPAVRLFVDRVRDVEPGFELTSDNTAEVVELCRRLDGLPLALELAATWLRLLTPRQLLQRLDEHLERPGAPIDLPGRQQTMNATIGWSYELLPEAARKLLARLTVFAAPFTAESAQAISGQAAVGAAESLALLLDHNMVSPAERPDGERAFRILNIIRRYAADRLKNPDDPLDRLEGYVLGVLERASAQHGGTDWARRLLDSEVRNVHAPEAQFAADFAKGRTGSAEAALAGAWAALEDGAEAEAEPL